MVTGFLAIALVMLPGGDTPKDQELAAPPPKEEVLARLKKSTRLDALSAALPKLTDEQDDAVLEAWRRMDNSTSKIADAADDRPISVEYRRSLMDNVEVLEGLKKADLTPAQKVDLCKSIAADLEVKAKYTLGRIRQKKDNPFGPIRVTVHTNEGTTEVSGFDVCYAATVRVNHVRYFKKASSPTTEPLAPGEYKLWAKKGMADGSQKTVLIGNTGNDMDDVDLMAPSKPGRD
jgi:hypothetical protein